MRNSDPILLAEDDNVDVMTLEPALNDLKVTNRLVCTSNGEEAPEYLKAKSNKKPCVTLLDLNMPKLNRIEELGAAGYIVKPVDYGRFVETVRTIDLYWTLSELPNGG